MNAAELTQLVSALIIVESNNIDSAIGDQGKALGPLQIRREVIADVNRLGLACRWEEMTNRAKARAVCETYLRHYAKGKSLEETARIWNGGPQGYRKQATARYWVKVKGSL